ncbi:hypothetical protein TNCV_3844631 [Trichonephila clavipes]|nr:hypothetical protein TNCV_3844631 [Trichonephila clavipes]
MIQLVTGSESVPSPTRRGRGPRILGDPEPMLSYVFAILCEIQPGVQNLTLMEVPNILRYITGLSHYSNEKEEFC